MHNFMELGSCKNEITLYTYLNILYRKTWQDKVLESISWSSIMPSMLVEIQNDAVILQVLNSL